MTQLSSEPFYDPEVSLKMLKEGNLRFARGEPIHPNRSLETRSLTSNNQSPFATVIGCSDSRASPEILFDQGIGDIFVVRTAGNVAGPIEINSIEFSTSLGSSLIVVLGHEKCGAITAVLNNQIANIEAVATEIKPALCGHNDSVENATIANISYVVEKLSRSRNLAELIEKKKLKIVGGYYNFQSGLVNFLD